MEELPTRYTQVDGLRHLGTQECTRCVIQKHKPIFDAIIHEITSRWSFGGTDILVHLCVSYQRGGDSRTKASVKHRLQSQN